MNDPYSVLGITPSATEEEIKKAYRSKCKEFHPDLHPGDAAAEEKFKEVQAAYSEIMKIKQNGGSYTGGYAGGGSGYGGQQYYRSGYGSAQQNDPFGLALTRLKPFSAAATATAVPGMAAAHRPLTKTPVCRPPETISMRAITPRPCTCWNPFPSVSAAPAGIIMQPWPAAALATA